MKLKITFVILFLSGIKCQEEVCFAQGTCVHSTTVGGQPGQNYNDCLEACRDSDQECLYFSFVPSGYCIFFKNCQGGPIASECPNCLTGIHVKDYLQ